MTDSVAVIASTMRADAEALRAISQNVANAQTPAYRREVPLAYATFDAAAAASAAADDGTLRLGSGVDLRPGTLQSTGEPLNLAIEGAGFFVVNTAQGERLTRRGDFHLDAQGQIVTAAGDLVLGAEGPVQVDGNPVISADGSVRVGDNVVGRLRLAQVENAAALQSTGEGLYAIADGEEAIDSRSAQIRQGFLESSNVQSVGEVISLMETMRHFEAAQRFVRGYDSMLESAISTLGKI